MLWVSFVDVSVVHVASTKRIHLAHTETLQPAMGHRALFRKSGSDDSLSITIRDRQGRLLVLIPTPRISLGSPRGFPRPSQAFGGS